MQIRIFSFILAFTSLFSLFSSQSVFAKINVVKGPGGKTIITDHVQPSDKDYEREIWDKGGNVKEKIEKTKTPEQREHDRRLARLKADEEKIIARQKIYDLALLSTYHSKADLMIAIAAKMKAFETQNQVIEGNLTRLKQALDAQEKAAAALERNGETVPEKLLADIKSTQKQMQEMQMAINAQKDKQNLIKKADEADIARFVFLTQSYEIKPRARIASVKEANELGLFYCENDAKCNKAWAIGRDFVKYYSTTPEDVFNDRLIMNRPPATDTDISLSLSKIPLNEQDSQLFLDIHCQDSSAGKAMCDSQKVKDIRATFSPFVNDALSRSAQQ